MIHTATLTCVSLKKAVYESFKQLDDTFYNRADNRLINRRYKGQGVVVSLYIIRKEKYTSFVAECRVNFKRLNEKENHTLVYAHGDLIATAVKFDEIMIDLGLPDFTRWKVKRMDFCTNIVTPYVSQYIKLMQKGDIPLSQRMTYDRNTRNYSMRSGSVYLPSKARDLRTKTTGSTTINFYDKHDQLLKESKVNTMITPEMLLQAENILRIEVQCHKPKLNYISRKYNLHGRDLVQLLPNPEIIQMGFDVLETAILSVCRSGNYYRASEAKKKIEDSSFRKTTKQAMLQILSTVNRSYGSIYKAREELALDRDKFNKLLQKFDALGINPVTISDNRKISGKGIREGLSSVYDLFIDSYQAELLADDSASD